MGQGPICVSIYNTRFELTDLGLISIDRARFQKVPICLTRFSVRICLTRFALVFFFAPDLIEECREPSAHCSEPSPGWFGDEVVSG